MPIYWISWDNSLCAPRTISSDEVIGLSINGREFYAGGDEQLCVYEEYLTGFLTSDLPPQRSVLPVEDYTKYSIQLGSFPGEFVWTGDRLQCTIESTTLRSSRTGKYDPGEVRRLFRLARAVKESRCTVSEITSLKISRYPEQIFMTVTLCLPGDRAIEVDLAELRVLWESIVTQAEYPDGRTDTPRWDTEVLFTKLAVIPALRRCHGVKNVRYTHGTDEYGRDVTFSFADPFGVLRHGAVQVKIGDVSGQAAGLVDKILGQVHDAFEMPFVDLVSKEQRYISQMIIAVSGKFSSNAQSKILAKLPAPLRSNVVFFDGEKIVELLAPS